MKRVKVSYIAAGISAALLAKRFIPSIIRYLRGEFM
jgi:hypothetical protein